MAWHDNFTVFDTETTGLDESARIIEIGVVHFYKGKIVREWTALIHPNGVYWEEEKVQKALAVNKITFDEICGKPLFEEVRLEFLQEMSEEVWVAHNIKFDVRMVTQELKRLGEKLEYQPDLQLDTMTLDVRLNPGKMPRTLEAVAERWGVVYDVSHRAVADARTCGQVLWNMVRAGRLPDDPRAMRQLQLEGAEAWAHRER